MLCGRAAMGRCVRLPFSGRIASLQDRHWAAKPTVQLRWSAVPSGRGGYTEGSYRQERGVSTLSPGHGQSPVPPPFHPPSSREERSGDEPTAAATDAPTNANVGETKRLRPLSPFLSIYEPQLTWFMSIGHRITGAGLGAVVYLGGLGYMVAPSDVAVTSLAELVGTMVPMPLFVAAKWLLAMPFCYHVLNGVRHLVWDTGRALSLKGVYYGGYLVNLATIVGAIVLVVL